MLCIPQSSMVYLTYFDREGPKDNSPGSPLSSQTSAYIEMIKMLVWKKYFRKLHGIVLRERKQYDCFTADGSYAKKKYTDIIM